MKAKNVIWKRNSNQHLLLMKHSDQLQQPWTLRLRSRAKRCRFSFIYSKILPISTNSRLSIRFDLRPFTLEFESKPESAFSLKRKLKFIQIFRSGNNGIVKSSNFWFGKRRRRRKKVELLWVVLLAVVIVIVIMVQQLRSYFRSRFLWNLVWMALPSGFLHQFFKVRFLYFCFNTSTSSSSIRRYHPFC